MLSQKRRERQHATKLRAAKRAQAPSTQQTPKSLWTWTAVFTDCYPDELWKFAQEMRIGGERMNINQANSLLLTVKNKCLQNPAFAAKATLFFRKTIARCQEKRMQQSQNLEEVRQRAIASANAHMLSRIPLPNGVLVSKTLKRTIVCNDERVYQLEPRRCSGQYFCFSNHHQGFRRTYVEIPVVSEVILLFLQSVFPLECRLLICGFMWDSVVTVPGFTNYSSDDEDNNYSSSPA